METGLARLEGNTRLWLDQKNRECVTLAWQTMKSGLIDGVNLPDRRQTDESSSSDGRANKTHIMAFEEQWGAESLLSLCGERV